MEKVPCLKKDAKFTVEIDASEFIQFQSLLTYLAKDKTSAFRDNIRDKIRDRKELTHEEASIVTVSLFCNKLLTIAKEKDFIEEKEMSEAFGL